MSALSTVIALSLNKLSPNERENDVTSPYGLQRLINLAQYCHNGKTKYPLMEIATNSSMSVYTTFMDFLIISHISDIPKSHGLHEKFDKYFYLWADQLDGIISLKLDITSLLKSQRKRLSYDAISMFLKDLEEITRQRPEIMNDSALTLVSGFSTSFDWETKWVFSRMEFNGEGRDGIMGVPPRIKIGKWFSIHGRAVIVINIPLWKNPETSNFIYLTVVIPDVSDTDIFNFQTHFLEDGAVHRASTFNYHCPLQELRSSLLTQSNYLEIIDSWVKGTEERIALDNALVTLPIIDMKSQVPLLLRRDDFEEIGDRAGGQLFDRGYYHFIKPNNGLQLNGLRIFSKILVDAQGVCFQTRGLPQDLETTKDSPPTSKYSINICRPFMFLIGEDVHNLHATGFVFQ